MRVSKKDNLFAASRFVLPEHRELYLQDLEDQKLIPHPGLSAVRLCSEGPMVGASEEQAWSHM